MSVFFRHRGVILAFVAGGASVVAVLVGGGKVLDYKNSYEHCANSCHAMSFVAAEYEASAHFTNPSGVRAVCADCHESYVSSLHDIRRAVNNFYHAMVGTIDTAEKYEKRRIDLAERVWADMESNRGAYCLRCHSFKAMDFGKQSADAQKQMPKAAHEGQACVSCHKGLVHKMPDLAGRAREKLEAFMTQQEPLREATLFAKRSTALFAEPEEDSARLATVIPGVTLDRLDHKGDFVRVRASGWQAGESARGQYALFGKRILSLSIASDALDRVVVGETRRFEEGDQDWKRTSLEGWVPAKDLTGNQGSLWSVADVLYSAQCGVCHATNPPHDRDTLNWQSVVQQYQDKTSLTAEERRLVLRYLQENAADARDARRQGG